MYERYLGAAGTDLGFFINQPRLLFFKCAKLSFDIADAEANVVQSLTSFGNKFAYWCLGRKRFEQLDMSVACVQFGDSYALLFNGFNGEAAKTKRVLVGTQGVIQS